LHSCEQRFHETKQHVIIFGYRGNEVMKNNIVHQHILYSHVEDALKEFCWLWRRDIKYQCRGRRCLEIAMRIVLFCNTHSKTARSTADKDDDVNINMLLSKALHQDKFEG
jgi:hypothetical protein